MTMMMKFSLCALAALALLRCAESMEDTESMVKADEDCPETVMGSSIGLKPLNFESHTMMNIFLDKTIQRYGNVSAWRYFATRAGDAYFAVWRKDGSNMRMVGSNKVSSAGRALQSLSVPVDDQIIVEKGDMIGMHYPVESATIDLSDRALGIMYFEDSRYVRTAGIDESKLSSIIAEPIYHNYLSLSGLVIPRVRSEMKREIALEAVVVCETCNKILKGSNVGLKALNYKSSSYMNIFVDKKFVYSGVLTSWRYLAYRSGDLYLSVWRKDSQFELIGFNKVSCPGEGKQEFKVPESDQIQVEIGDMIGVHYPAKKMFKQESGVLYYEDVRNVRTEGVKDEDLSGLVANPFFDDSLKVGKKIFPDIRNNITREISMEAVIASTADCRKVLTSD